MTTKPGTKVQRSRQRSHAFAPLLGAVAFLSAAGCSCEDEAPYTPYKVGSSSQAASDTDAVAPEASAEAPPPAPTFQGRASVKAPTAATSWKLAGFELKAPSGQVYEQALEADFDGDNKPDVVAWSVAQELGQGAAGSLWYYPSAGKPKALTDLPGFVPTGPNCKLTTKLDQTGPGSVSLITRAACTGSMLPRIPVGALSVLAPARATPKLLELRLADVVPGERRKLQLDTTDRDSDGLEDISLRLRLERDGSNATASFSWYQRAQGTAVDDAEPRRSLEALSQSALAAAKAQGQKAMPQIQTARRLWVNVCGESKTPRLFAADGSPLSCRAESMLARLNEAEVRAALKDKQPATALAALERGGWFGGFDPKLKGSLESTVLGEFERKTVKAQKLSVQALSRGPEPRFSPLSFESSGALLVQTSQGVQRVSPAGEAADASEEVDAWALTLKSDAGAVSRVTTPCDAAQLEFAISTGDGKLTPTPIPLLSPRPGACAAAGPPEIRVAVLGFGAGGFEGFVAGTPVGQKNRAEAVMRPHVPGSARSPDGKHEVLVLNAGLVVLSDGKPQLWSAEGVPGDFGDCVVANAAAAVACVSASGSVTRFTP